MTTRLLLVEFLNDDPLQQHRNRPYPYFQGLSRAHGAEARWVSIAAGKDARPAHPWEVELPDDRRRRLFEAIEEFAPTVLVSNERLSATMRAALSAAFPDARLFAPPDPLLTDCPLSYAASSFDLPAPASDADRRSGLFTEVEPDYETHRLDPETPTADHFVPVFIEPECLYARSIAHNPFFEGIEPDREAWVGGCTFCQRHGGFDDVRLERETAVGRVLGQLRRYHETTDPAARRRRFMMLVAPALRWIGDVFAGMLDLGLPPIELYFTSRIDELLSAEEALRRCLPELAAVGHQLHFWQLGLENFSPEENRRFNKGVTPEEVERASNLLNGLEQAWPETVYFQRHGGFGMIVFTPWTRLEDLRINATEIQRLGLREQYSMLTSVLLLRRGTPLETLARRDGLLPEDTDTPDPFHAICITAWGEDALPWRFRHREVAVVHEAMAALFPGRGAVVGPDALATVDRLRESTPWAEVHEAEILAALVEATKAAPGATSSELLTQVWDTLVWPRIPAGEQRRAEDQPRPDTDAQESADAEQAGDASAQGGTGSAPDLPPWLVRAKALFDVDALDASVDLGGATVEEADERLSDSEPPALGLRLSRDGETVNLLVSAAADDGPRYCVAGGAAISYDNATPLDSDTRKALLQTIVDVFEARTGVFEDAATGEPRPA